eukprot:8768907-Pyramimonas_sp.AAC.1
MSRWASWTLLTSSFSVAMSRLSTPCTFSDFAQIQSSSVFASAISVSTDAAEAMALLAAVTVLVA